jgi:hypothetical protein
MEYVVDESNDMFPVLLPPFPPVDVPASPPPPPAALMVNAAFPYPFVNVIV